MSHHPNLFSAVSRAGTHADGRGITPTAAGAQAAANKRNAGGAEGAKP